jgi:Peroxiredoxin
MIKPTMVAPDFSADAYYLGNKVTVKLSSYTNDWVVLFFYASDFTFV